MTNDELIEFVDETGIPTGIAPRSEIHARGLWHRAVHVWVLAADSCGGRILFQQRAATKDVEPGMFDVSVGGHLAPGEKPCAGALRELEEELGVVASFEDLQFLGVRQTAHRYHQIIDQEVQSIYCLRHSMPLDTYCVNEEEIAAISLLGVGEGLRFFSTPGARITEEVAVAGNENVLLREMRTLAQTDFIPSLDRYFYRACIVAQQVLRGDTYIAL